jgi:hypothetical protein
MTGLEWATKGSVIGALILSALSGCAVHKYRLSRAEFEAAYSAPYDRWQFCEYRGVENRQHRLFVYSLGTQSAVHHCCTFVVPSDEMPADFPRGPQRPIQDQLTGAERSESMRVWHKLPAYWYAK